MNSAGGGTGICSWRLQRFLQYPSSSCTEIAGWKVIWAKPYIRSWVRWAPTRTPCLVQVNSSKYFGVENYLHCPSIFKRPYIFCRKRSAIHRRVESHLLWGCRIDKIARHILSRWIGPPTQPRLLQGSCCHDGGIRYEVGSAQISIDSWSTALILYGLGGDRVMWPCDVTVWCDYVRDILDIVVDWWPSWVHFTPLIHTMQHQSLRYPNHPLASRTHKLLQ